MISEVMSATHQPHTTVQANALHAKRMEARARRAAQRAGWVARKTRWRAGSVDNLGGFAIIDPYTNTILHGERFNLTAGEVIDICTSGTED